MEGFVTDLGKLRGKKIRHSYSARKQRCSSHASILRPISPSHRAFVLSQPTHKAYKRAIPHQYQSWETTQRWPRPMRSSRCTSPTPRVPSTRTRCVPFHISFRAVWLSILLGLVRRQMMMSAIDVDVYYLLHFEGIQRDGWEVDVSKVLIWKACGTSGAADPRRFTVCAITIIADMAFGSSLRRCIFS